MAVFLGTLGDDVFYGGADDDLIDGQAGNDQLSGAGGNDDLAGGAGADSLDGGDGADTLYSDARSPPFHFPYYGSSFTPPVFDVGREVDTLRGGEGSDTLFAGYGDNVDGGGGSDHLYISFMGATSGVVVDFRMATQVVGGGIITGIESANWVEGSDFDDEINLGFAGARWAGYETVFGRGGNDHLVAGEYTETMFGGDGDDVIDGRASVYLQTVRGEAGNDTLYTSADTYCTAVGGAGDDIIYAYGTSYGGTGNDLIVLQDGPSFGFAVGEAGDDEIRASSGGNSISGGDGADILIGGAGDDLLVSANFVSTNVSSLQAADDIGLERDWLSGGGGNDMLAAGYGDEIDGGAGTDTLRLSLAGLTSGIVFSTAGVVSGQPFNMGGATIRNVEILSYLRGTNFADTLTLVTQSTQLSVDAGDGDDVIVAGDSAASISGGAGNDRLVREQATVAFDGGAGIDTVDYRNALSGVALSLAAGDSVAIVSNGDQLSNVENIDGSAFADDLTGSTDANAFHGGAGDDFLRGAGGDDILHGDAGNDRLEGGDGSDLLLGGEGADVMLGGDGDDMYEVDDVNDVIIEAQGQGTDGVFAYANLTLPDNVENLYMNYGRQTDGYGNASNNIIIGNAQANVIEGRGGTDIIVGDDGNDTLDGGSGNDRLEGGDGADVLLGGTGSDLMIGGQGSDLYEVDSAGDVVFEQDGAGTADNVYAYVDFTLPTNVENLIMLYGNQRFGTGNAGNNIIIGNGQSNVIEGGAGYDTLTGGAGSDLFIVRPGFGVDVITDFVAGAGTPDAILFSTALFTSFAQVIANAAQVGADTWIGDGHGNTVVLIGVSLGSLAPDDFAYF